MWLGMEWRWVSGQSRNQEVRATIQNCRTSVYAMTKFIYNTSRAIVAFLETLVRGPSPTLPTFIL